MAALLDHPISIESVPGKGTIVRVLLPLALPQEGVVAPSMSIVDNLRDKRVLIVDDEAPVREAMQGLLLRWGCQVSTAASGDEAIARARERRPEAVLCDLDLGEGDFGVEVVQILQRECAPGVACAFVTGDSSAERIAKARATGHPIAFKPITPGKLRAILEHLVS